MAGNTASRLVSERSALYRALEQELAQWKNAESALVFPSGYAANVGVLQAVCSRDTEVFSDRQNHASIVDGIRLSGARLSRYRHCDMEDLRRRLQASRATEKLLVTDSVFSMDGDRAPLDLLCELAAKYGCMVMVDEAHAAGLFGRRGSGLVEEHGLEDRIDLRIGTLSKAVAGLGGFVAASSELCRYLVNFARSFVYSTGLPHAVLAWDFAAVRFLRANPGLGAEVLDMADHLRGLLHGLGIDTGSSTTQIVPCVVGESHAMELHAMLAREGIAAPAIRPPTVPAGTGRVRFSVHRGLGPDDLSAVIDVVRSWQTGHRHG
jgi:8-amino-7-oxononanoate synthase